MNLSLSSRSEAVGRNSVDLVDDLTQNWPLGERILCVLYSSRKRLSVRCARCVSGG